MCDFSVNLCMHSLYLACNMIGYVVYTSVLISLSSIACLTPDWLDSMTGVPLPGLERELCMVVWNCCLASSFLAVAVALCAV